jgi:homoserine dehydrogenase
VAEADPTLDVDGLDTANKLVIVANSVLRQPSTLANVTPVTGIAGITPDAIQAQSAKGYTVKLVASADWHQDQYKLSVEPEWLPANDFLANVNGWEMGIVLETDIMGIQQFKVDERGPMPTAAAMLRDLINLLRGTAATPY